MSTTDGTMAADPARRAAPPAPLPGAGVVSSHPGWLKAAAMLATLLQVLDMTIANVALPHMQAALGANQDSISWVLTSYIVASAIAIPATGWLSDHIGRRPLYLLSIVGFTLSSVLCGLAVNLDSMVFFRVMQGLSGAFLSPLGQTVMLDSSPPEKRGQAMAIFGMGVMIGPILGPVLGGWLTENMNWRWVFFVNVPLGLIALLGLFLFLPDVKRASRPLDVLGLVLLGTGLASLQLMLDRGQHVDWFKSAEIWLETGVAISAFWMFAIHSFTARNPLYPLALLRDRNLLIGTLLMMMLGLILTSAMSLLPMMLQSLMNYPVLDAGFMMAVRGVGVFIMMGITNRLTAIMSVRTCILAGFALISFSFWKMTGWTLEVGSVDMAVNGLIQGLGIGMLFVPISLVAFSSLPTEFRTDASGIINLARSVGASAGISLVVTMLARNASTSHEDIAAHLTPYNLWLDPKIFFSTDTLSTALTALNAEVTRQAMMVAFLDDFYLMMILSILATPLVLLIKPSRNEASSQDAIVIE